MPDNNDKTTQEETLEKPSEEKWTIMFFFASDNALSPLQVSQIKGIKDAGFQKNTDVVVYFDSNERGVPTRIYEVNSKRKQRGIRHGEPTSIGDGPDPSIEHISDDDIVPKVAEELEAVAKELEEEDRKLAARKLAARTLKSLSGKPDDVTPEEEKLEARKAAVRAMKMFIEPDAVNATEALKSFLALCVDKHPAKHYLLFLVGHGMIVGNDRFLPDENPDSAITLQELEGILRGAFKNSKADGVLELLALHSCSMSAVEVAYQLKDSAKYMMATQGLSFVGSWPYRQLIMKVFDRVERNNGSVKVRPLLDDIFDLSLHCGTDFMTAGYSSELCLTKLSSAGLITLRNTIGELANELKGALLNEYGRASRPLTDAILLSHWNSQSYWQEDYTDLFDFCECLNTRLGNQSQTKSLSDACSSVQSAIAEITLSDHFGWRYQYSHGLSIYFPWSEPIGDVNQHVLRNYGNYQLTKDLQEETVDNSWLSFLRVYFDKTQRKSREEEDRVKRGEEEDRVMSDVRAAIVAFGSSPFGSLAGPDKTVGSHGGPVDNKTSGASGEGCSCPTIKNYPMEEVEFNKRPRARRLSIGEKAGPAFERFRDLNQTNK